MTWRDVVHDWVPPVVLRFLRGLRHSMPWHEWEVARAGWDTPARGWNVEGVARVQAARWQRYVEAIQGTAPVTIARESDSGHIADLIGHNAAMMFGYVLTTVARRKGQLSVLDWGGAFGHYSVLARALVRDVSFDYTVYDVPRIVEEGRRLNGDVTFSDERAAALSRRYDLVMASSSIWYERDWRTLVRELAQASDSLYICRMAFVFRSPSVVAIQRPMRGASYATEYLCWVLNRDEFVEHVASCGMTLVREFFMEDGPAIRRLEEQPLYRGFLFRRQTT
ncbi:MAG TPA: methyltransferase, TIGR04325 family [Thermoanaerobaculia bacterium]|jgi:putative methyltransferase (TIGR04325 family)